MRGTKTVLVLLGMASAGLAEPMEEAVARSAAFADAAHEAMSLGRRPEAIATALKGLPEGASEADLETFAAAHTALFRAMAARIVGSEAAGQTYYAVNVAGDRAVAGGFNLIDPSTDDPAPYTLFDPRDGTEIAELADFAVSISAVYGPGAPPAMSPDGSELALWAMIPGEVLRFATADGSALPTLADLAAGGDRPGAVIGYAPDGSRLAAQRDRRIAIWDLSTGDLIETTEVPYDQWATGWTAEGALIGLRVADYEPDAAAALHLYRDGAWQEVMDLTGRTGRLTQYVTVSEWGPHVLLHGERRVYLADFEAGTVANIGRTGQTFHRFVQDGTAVAVRVPGGFLGMGAPTLRVTTLDGVLLDLEARDWAVFDQYVTDGTTAPENLPFVRPYTYRAADLPDGPDLISAAEAMLDQEARAAVAAERVAPD